MEITKKFNSKGQLIEELDVPEIKISLPRAPFQSPKPVSPKRVSQEADIISWCDAYLALKKKGIEVYKVR